MKCASKHPRLSAFLCKKLLSTIVFFPHKPDICKQPTDRIYLTSMIRTRCLSFILPLLLCLSCVHSVKGQYKNCPYTPYRMSIHLVNPLSALSKVGFRLQYRFGNKNSVLLDYRSYHSFFPGYQASGEYHRSFAIQNAENEAFFYGRAGYGSNQEYTPKPYYAGAEDKFGPVGNYLFAGAGVGKRINFGHFFIEGNMGLKLAQPVNQVEDYNKYLFHTLGPGSFFDCGIHLGIQFFDEERNMYNRDMRPRKPRIHY